MKQTEIDIEALKEKIINRLKSVNRKGMDKLIDYLTSRTDYFTAPASTTFHNNFKHGLALHSDNVTELLIEKNKRFNLNLSMDTIYITGYLHDLCKCNNYEEGYKIVKDDDGKWVGQKSYVTRDDILPLGHGSKSIIIAQQMITLTVEEALMINWHMGGYAPKEDYKELNKAIQMYPSVLAFHTADNEASHLMEVVVEPELRPVEEYNEYIKKKKNKK